MQAKFTAGAAVAAILAVLGSAPAHPKPDWTAVGQALGKSGTELPGGVYRVPLARHAKC